VFMDVEYQTSLRPDGHFGWMEGKYDCLHYCAPGPMDTWVQMLFNAPRSRVQSKLDNMYCSAVSRRDTYPGQLPPSRAGSSLEPWDGLRK